MAYKIDTKKPRLLHLFLLISFPSVATVLISPALPAISNYYQISSGYAEQLITVFMIGYAAGQLIYSPIANRYGRKVAIYVGVILYTIACVICLIAIYIPNIQLLIFGRLLMALGASVGMIVTFTIINDFYNPDRARVIVSYTVLAYAFMPAIAISLGGFLTTHLNWIDCFYFLLVYGIVILKFSTRLPETITQRDNNALKFKPIIKSYINAFSNQRLILFSIINGLMASYIYLIASGAPFIAIDRIGMTPDLYSSLLLIPYTGQIIGSLAAGKLNNLLRPYQIISIALCVIFTGVALIFTSFTLKWINIYTLIIPIFFIMLGLPLTYGSITIMALITHKDKATASAIMSFITLLISLIFTFTLTLFPQKNIIILPLLFTLVIIAAISLFWFLRNRYANDCLSTAS